MAVRTPLVLGDDGLAQQLQAGDALAGAGGGGGAPVLSAVLDVATLALGYAEVLVASPGVTSASKVQAWLVGELDAENDIEELADTNMRVFAVAEAGQIRFVLTGNSAFTGAFTTNYQVN